MSWLHSYWSGPDFWSDVDHAVEQAEESVAEMSWPRYFWFRVRCWAYIAYVIIWVLAVLIVVSVGSFFSAITVIPRKE